MKLNSMEELQERRMSKEYWDEWAKGYETKEPEKLTFFEKWLFDKMLSRIDLTDDSTVLDLGTGTGKLILYLAKKNKNCHYIAFDISEEQLENAKKYCKDLDVEFLQGELPFIPLEDNSVDYVVSNATLHHIEDKKKLFSEIYRVLKPNGKVVFSDLYEDNLSEKYKKEVEALCNNNPSEAQKFKESIESINIADEFKEPHPAEYHLDPYSLKEVMEEAGFKELEVVPGYKLFAVIHGQK